LRLLPTRARRRARYGFSWWSCNSRTHTHTLSGHLLSGRRVNDASADFSFDPSAKPVSFGAVNRSGSKSRRLVGGGGGEAIICSLWASPSITTLATTPAVVNKPTNNATMPLAATSVPTAGMSKCLLLCVSTGWPNQTKRKWRMCATRCAALNATRPPPPPRHVPRPASMGVKAAAATDELRNTAASTVGLLCLLCCAYGLALSLLFGK
jgi:hypothetical protein